MHLCGPGMGQTAAVGVVPKGQRKIWGPFLTSATVPLAGRSCRWNWIRTRGRRRLLSRRYFLPRGKGWVLQTLIFISAHSGPFPQWEPSLREAKQPARRGHHRVQVRSVWRQVTVAVPVRGLHVQRECLTHWRTPGTLPAPTRA